MARLPYPDPEHLPPQVRQILAARPARNVFKMLSHAAAVALSTRTSSSSILDSDDGTRYRATIQGVTVEKGSPGNGLASVRGTVKHYV